MAGERTWPLPQCTVDEFGVEVRWLNPYLLRAVFLHVYADGEPIGIGYLTLDGDVSLHDLLVPDDEHPSTASADKLRHALRWLVGLESEPTRGEE